MPSAGPAGLTVRNMVVRPIDLDLSLPMETASGTMKTTPVVLIALHTREGITGKSYLRCYTSTALRALATLLTDIEPLLAGQDAAPPAVERLLRQRFKLLGDRGLVGAALAGIDMAAWDAQAKAARVPLATLLGASPRAIPAYASLRTMNPRGAAAEAQELVAAGFRAIKVKVGGGGLDGDLETIRTIRSAVGDGVALMVDYNQSLSIPEAIARGRALDGENLYWIEEPTLADDYAGYARIAAAVSTPIQLGENCDGTRDVMRAIEAKACDYLMLDAMKSGGVSGWMRAARLAKAASLPVSSHTFPEFSAHLLAATPTVHWLEYLDHVGPILERPVVHRDGCIVIPDTPGAGADWDEVVAARL